MPDSSTISVFKQGASLLTALIAGILLSCSVLIANGAPGQAAQAPVARQVGTIKSIQGSSIVLTTDAGDVHVTVQEGARVVRVEPGQKDLKGATAMELKDLQAGDRILVRGQASADAKSFTANGVIAMKHVDIEAKQQHDREEWQKHGIGGLVSGVDPAAGIVTIGVGTPGATANIAVHVSKDSVIRRYAPDSVKFDDAKPSTLDAIQPGDQLRARGVRSADGKDFQAQEIVSGAFRNIAGTVSSVDAATNSISVSDAISKRDVTVKITSESQVRKLPPEMAQRIAARLKASAGGASGASPAGAPAGQAQIARPNGGAGGAGNSPAGGGRPPDFQQLLSRLPAATLADLQKGDAVMIVSTEGGSSGQVTAITLLAGVEPILTASPREAQAMLSPWSLGAGGAEAGADANQ